ncbi:MAG: alanyl-tRNA editing protein [Chloroflexota bacterium]
MNHAQYLHYDDPDCTCFTALVQETIDLPDGRMGVVLDRTYFYATGGGQEHDTGALGAARVVDVFKDETRGVIVHVLTESTPASELPAGKITGQIDAERRMRHRQHHSAQHLLTQCFIRLFGLETLSANINGTSPSTLDVPFTSLSKDDLDRAESLANQIIYENRAIKSYLVTPEALSKLPLRKAPKVSADIRIVEIEGCDYSACGGTHVYQTGQIGLLKVVKTERQNDRLRVHFIAGWQALQTFRAYFEALNNLANQMSAAPFDVPGLVARQSEQLQAIQKELQALRLEQIGGEARRLAANATSLDGQRLAVVGFENRPPLELRALADGLKAEAGLIAVLTSFDGQKLSVLVTCAADTGLSAADLLRSLLVPLNGRGGGSPQMAQGGGPAAPEQQRVFHETLQAHVTGWLQRTAGQ